MVLYFLLYACCVDELFEFVLTPAVLALFLFEVFVVETTGVLTDAACGMSSSHSLATGTTSSKNASKLFLNSCNCKISAVDKSKI